jgi:hypothetical protein
VEEGGERRMLKRAINHWGGRKGGMMNKPRDVRNMDWGKR